MGSDWCVRTNTLQVTNHIAEIYNPSLRTLSGPWDRTYGFDLTQYCGILGTVITALVGRDNAKGKLTRVLAHLEPLCLQLLTVAITSSILP